MKISTEWLKDFVDLKPPIPSHAEALTEAGLEVEAIEKSASGDSVFQIEVTTNRPDWLSHYGVARELAAIHGYSLNKPKVADESKLSRTPPAGWKITCRDAEACPYYTGILIEGITEKKIPEFITRRLESCGLRSIELIVDITNYVLLELGQPLHAFDADILAGQQIVIRRAKKGEKLAMISGSTLELDEKDLIIADGEKALALAGVMGGKDSEITPRTRNIFLETAHFQPRTVRESSRRHQLSTDSSYRFERRVDPCLVDLARQRALALIIEYAKPRHVSGILNMGSKPNASLGTLHLTEEQVNTTLGCEIKGNQIVSILNRLGLEAKTISAKSWKVNVPSFRSDLTRPVDLIEEIARIHGYDKIPGVLPVFSPGAISANPLRRTQKVIREALSGAGFHETVTFSIISNQGFSEADTEKMVKLRNPLQAGLEWMRPTLLPGLLSAVQKNLRHGAEDIRLFEMAHVYRREGKEAKEEKAIGFLWTGSVNADSWLDATRPASYSDLAGVVDVILNKAGVSAALRSQGAFTGLAGSNSEKIMTSDMAVIGFAGQVSSAWMKALDLKHPVYYAELRLEELTKGISGKRKFQDIPKYPAMTRDLSITVPEATLCGQVETDIRKAGGTIVREIKLFDLFQGGRVQKGFKNLSFRLTYLSPEKTLVSEDVDALHTKIAAILVEKYQAQFQSK